MPDINSDLLFLWRALLGLFGLCSFCRSFTCPRDVRRFARPATKFFAVALHAWRHFVVIAHHKAWLLVRQG